MLDPHMTPLLPAASSIRLAIIEQSFRVRSSTIPEMNFFTVCFVGLVFASAIGFLCNCPLLTADCSLACHYRQLNKTRPAPLVINPLRRLLVILRLRPENVRHKFLWIAIVKRKPARLNLDHDPMPRLKHMIRRRQRPLIK